MSRNRTAPRAQIRAARPHREALPVILILAGLVLAGAGLLRGEAAEVFRKAARLCLECMGLGY